MNLKFHTPILCATATIGTALAVPVAVSALDATNSHAQTAQLRTTSTTPFATNISQTNIGVSGTMHTPSGSHTYR